MHLLYAVTPVIFPKPRVLFKWCCDAVCLMFQTADEYMAEYDLRRKKEYSRFHGYTYDGVWAVALAIRYAASRIRHYNKNETMVDFRYRDDNWEKVFLEALKNTSFEGVTVSSLKKSILSFYYLPHIQTFEMCPLKGLY